MTLTDQEYNFLMELSARTKMDCWFWIETDDDGNDFVLDLENDEALPLHEGIAQLFDGILCFVRAKHLYIVFQRGIF